MNAGLALLTIHFIADFILQSDWMAVNKSKRFWPLCVHVAIYSSCFLLFGWKMAAVTFIAHLTTDAITSRISSRLWAAKQTHWFFVCIGFDQLLHAYQLFLTYKFLHGAL